MTFPAVSDVSEFPPLVSLSAKVAAAYLSSRQDVPIERVGDLIEGVYRSLVRIAVVEDTGAAAVCRFLDTPVGQEAMSRPALRVVGGTDQPS
jgi:hypothetical protein